MQYKMLVIDLDGTLLTKTKNISKANLQGLKKYISLGGKVVLSTGRSLENTLKIVHLIHDEIKELIQYISCFNGSYIYDVINEKVLFESTINKDIVNEIYKFSLKHGLGFWPYNQRFMQTHFLDVYNINYKFLLQLHHTKRKVCLNPIFNKNDKFYKINILPSNFVKKLKHEVIDQLIKEFSDQVNISFTSKYIVEVTNKNINKASSLRFIANLYQINLDKVATIGDSPNDIPMFKISGLAAAARTKSKTIIEHVDVIINYKNNSNSVALFINNYLLK